MSVRLSDRTFTYRCPDRPRFSRRRAAAALDAEPGRRFPLGVRIIAGEFRSRRLFSPPPDWAVRPITDRVKESVFSILRGHCRGATWVDAFAGTGSIGLEALSRGADRCVFIEMDRRAVEMLRANIAAVGAGDRAEVVASDALGAGALARCPRPCTIVFMDPPYALVEDAAGWRRVRDQAARFVECLSDDGFLLIRTPHPLRHPAPSDAGVARGDAPGPRRSRRGDGAREHASGPTVGVAGEASAPLRPADLSIAGAVGPETHAYGSMAVHFYARARA